MKNAWTPGPWQVAWTGWEGQVNIEASDNPLRTNGRSVHAKANRALIAAAPEMVEALSNMVEIVDFVERRYGGQINPPTVDNARTLLARINGEIK